MPAILEVENLTVKTGGRALVENVSFSLQKGCSLGILGESGSGKSITCKAVMGLLPKYFEVSGSIRFMGQELLGLPLSERRKLRGRGIGYIMQNPMTAFDPLCTIGAQMTETLTTHFDYSSQQATAEAIATLDKMLIRNPEHVLKLFPHELSGGMLQRVMIGLTLALEPQFIFADEPTTALDVITQDEVMNIFITMKKELATSIVFVSHDLGVIAKIADSLLVMSCGNVVETGSMKQIFENPATEHAKYLLNSRLSVMQIFHEKVGGFV